MIFDVDHLYRLQGLITKETTVHVSVCGQKHENVKSPLFVCNKSQICKNKLLILLQTFNTQMLRMQQNYSNACDQPVDKLGVSAAGLDGENCAVLWLLLQQDV